MHTYDLREFAICIYSKPKGFVAPTLLYYNHIWKRHRMPSRALIINLHLIFDFHMWIYIYIYMYMLAFCFSQTFIACLPRRKHSIHANSVLLGILGYIVV